MKEIIGQIIERLEAIFLPKRVRQPETEKANGNTRKLQRFPNERFDFRHNQLTGVTEYRPKEEDAPFRPIDERNMNGMIVDARLKGIVCWNSMVPTLVLSDKVESYNPFHLYKPTGNDRTLSYTYPRMSRTTPARRGIKKYELRKALPVLRAVMTVSKTPNSKIVVDAP